MRFRGGVRALGRRGKPLWFGFRKSHVCLVEVALA
jgi:hypothetical protein